jgi:uncharacterized protein YndB with AHSA1/START domain
MVSCGCEASSTLLQFTILGGRRMIDVSVNTSINRPVEEVFRFVEDGDNMPRWDPDLIRATKTSEGPMAVGTTFHLDIKPFMGETEGTGSVIAYEPNKLIELQWDMGKLKPHVYHIFTDDGARTTFTRRIHMDPSGVLRLMQPMMRRMIRKHNVQYLATLKRLIET